LVHCDSFSYDQFCEALAAPADEARPVLQALIGDDFLVAREEGGYCAGKKFRQLALATIGSGIDRQRAIELINGVLERARHINAHPDLFHVEIHQLALFGSYLTQAEILGDVDFALEMSIISVSGISAWGLFAKAISYLRRRQAYVRVHFWHELLTLNTPFKVVYSGKPRPINAC
jgi:hypothetical protein